MAVSRVIGKQVGGSFPGTISRSGDQLVQVKLANGEIGFGRAVVLDSGKYIEWFEDEATIHGIAVRKVGQPNVYVNQDDYNKYLDGEECDALTRGFVTVKLVDTTNFAINTSVNIVTSAGDSGFAVGDFVTSSTAMGSGSKSAISGWLYSAGVSDDGIAEIHILTTAI